MSKIEVNKIGPQCGTTTTIGSGASNPIVVDGSAVTLGRCGGTVALASGATQTGFGRTETVDWQTTAKTATFTAVSGEGYFANTSGSAFNMNLPAGVAGAIVSVADYAESFDSNNLTVVPNGTDKIGSINENAVLSTKGQSVTFVFVDSTQGWINTMDSTSNVRGTPLMVAATGGTITTSGNCKIHTFTGPGTFTVTQAASCATNNIVSHLIIAGGGGGGHDDGGGGGAGGFREVKNPVTPYTASPLDGYPSAPNRVTVTAQAYPITVGGGGAGGIPPCGGANGSNSIFSTITSAGGGFGERGEGAGGDGGSGGGGDAGSGGGTGNTPPTSPSQGQNGGSGGTGNAGGGGGGAGATGNNGSGSAPTSSGGSGGAGVTTEINASPVTRAGGGGGGGFGSAGSGGSGGGGSGATYPNSQATAGTANTGGGGGGGSTSTGPRDGKSGGSGIVIIRYKFQ